MLDEKILEAEKVSFDEATHTYVGTVSKAPYISVTTLLKKFGMTPSEYAVIPAAILAAKAKYGTEVHKALEEYINGDTSQLIIPEVAAFAEWLKSVSMSTLDCTSEQKVFNEYYKIAGTVDLQIWNIVADFKTTATLHIVPVMWQLSLYNFLLHPVETDYSKYELKCFWFNSAGELTVKDIPLIPYSRITSLLDAYARGETVWIDDSIPADLIDRVEAIVKQTRLINTLKNNLKSLENEKDMLKVFIESQMKEESRVYVDAPAGVVTITEVVTNRFNNDKVKSLLRTLGKPERDYMNTTKTTRMNIKDKGK